MKKLVVLALSLSTSLAALASDYADCSLNMKELKKSDVFIEELGKRALYLNTSIYNDTDMESYEVTKNMVFDRNSCSVSIKLMMPGAVIKYYVLNLNQEYLKDSEWHCNYTSTILDKSNETPTYLGLNCKKPTGQPY